MLLCLLIYAVFVTALAISSWLADANIGPVLSHACSILAACVIISLQFDLSIIAGLPAWIFIVVSALIGTSLSLCQRQQIVKNCHPVQVWRQWRKKPWIYRIILMAVFCYLSSAFVPHSGRWGRWDARAIWTLHALFLSHQDGWTNMFSKALVWSHPDYPLLLPSLIAMCWKAAGAIDAVVPCIIAYFTFIAVLQVISSGLRGRDRFVLGIAGLVPFVFSTDYIRMAASQGADTLLSLFILISIVLSGKIEKPGEAKLLVLIGFIAGFAGWIKNEGIAFTLVFSLGMIWRYRRANKRILPYLCGLALPLTVIILFKIIYAPPNDIASAQGHSSLTKLADISRYKLTLQFFIHQIWHLYSAGLVIISLVIIRSVYAILTCGSATMLFFKWVRVLFDWQLFVVLTMMICYFFTFILTPRDLYWHLETASDRLLLQLFPALLYVLISIWSEIPGIQARGVINID